MNPRINLRVCGATEEEAAFLVQSGSDLSGWTGERVELNALMSAGRFIDWLEGKLQAHGLQKVIPDEATLGTFYRRAWRRAQLQEAIDAATQQVDSDIPLPPGLVEMTRAAIDGTETPWDQAVWQIVRDQRRGNR